MIEVFRLEFLRMRMKQFDVDTGKSFNVEHCKVKDTVLQSRNRATKKGSTMDGVNAIKVGVRAREKWIVGGSVCAGRRFRLHHRAPHCQQSLIMKAKGTLGGKNRLLKQPPTKCSSFLSLLRIGKNQWRIHVSRWIGFAFFQSCLTTCVQKIDALTLALFSPFFQRPRRQPETKRQPMERTRKYIRAVKMTEQSFGGRWDW